METLTNEQIQQKLQLLAQKKEEAKTLYQELQEAGVIELSDDDLDDATGGFIHKLIKDIDPPTE